MQQLATIRNHDQSLRRRRLRAKGLTLVELLLTVALLGVLAGSALTMVYWPVFFNTSVAKTTFGVNRLVNTQVLMRKVLREIDPASLTVDTGSIQFQADPDLPAEVLFAVETGTLKHLTQPILGNVTSTFAVIRPGATITLPAALAASGTDLIHVTLQTGEPEPQKLVFVIRPRGGLPVSLPTEEDDPEEPVEPENEDFAIKNIFLYGTSLNLSGNASVTGSGSTVVLHGEPGEDFSLSGSTYPNVTNIYIGTSADFSGNVSIGSADAPGKVVIHGTFVMANSQNTAIFGDLYVYDDFTIERSDKTAIYGNVYVQGDVILKKLPNLASTTSKIYYTGTLVTDELGKLKTSEQAILDSRFVKQATVPYFGMPTQKIALRDDAWYAARSYVGAGALTNGAKILSEGNYTANVTTVTNVIVVSKTGDITISGTKLTGILLAPYGAVTISSDFEGTVICSKGFNVIGGNKDVAFISIESYLNMEDPDPYPVMFVNP